MITFTTAKPASGLVDRPHPESRGPAITHVDMCSWRFKMRPQSDDGTSKNLCAALRGHDARNQYVENAVEL